MEPSNYWRVEKKTKQIRTYGALNRLPLRTTVKVLTNFNANPVAYWRLVHMKKRNMRFRGMHAKLRFQYLGALAVSIQLLGAGAASAANDWIDLACMPPLCFSQGCHTMNSTSAVSSSVSSPVSSSGSSSASLAVSSSVNASASLAESVNGPGTGCGIPIVGSGMNMSHANFTGVDFACLNLADADLTHTNFESANLQNTVLSNAKMLFTDLTGADLSGSCLQGAEITIIKARAANLDGLNLRGANFSTQSPNGQTPIKVADCEQASFRWSDLTNAKFLGSNLRGADLSHALLVDAYLVDVNLGSSESGSTDLIGALLVETDLTGADLRFAKLSRADLTGANLRFADARFVDFRGAILRNADLGCANLQGANFAGADLEGANFYCSATEETAVISVDPIDWGRSGIDGDWPFFFADGESSESSDFPSLRSRDRVEEREKAPEKDAVPVRSNVMKTTHDTAKASINNVR